MGAEVSGASPCSRRAPREGTKGGSTVRERDVETGGSERFENWIIAPKCAPGVLRARFRPGSGWH